MNTSRLIEGVLLFLLCFVVYTALGQETLYKTDGRHLLRFVLGGSLSHPHHAFYLPMLDLAVRVGELFSLSPHRSGVLLSAAGIASGVGCVHIAAVWLGLGRGRALFAATLVATTPAVLFFATVVELHGPFFAFAGASTAAAALWTRRPSFLVAGLLGLLTGLSVGAHSTGHLLLTWLLPFVFVHVGDRLSQTDKLLRLGLCVVVHGLVSFLLPDLIGLFSIHVERGGNFVALVELAGIHLQEPADWFATWWFEWLLPCAPISVVWLMAARRQQTLLFACLPGLATTVTVTFLLLGPARESGAYLLPLVIPAALAVADRTPHRVRDILLLLVSLSLGLSAIWTHNDTRETKSYAAGYRAIADGRPTILVVGSTRDLDVCLLHLSDVHVKDFFEEAGLDPELLAKGLPILIDWLRASIVPPRQVLLTKGAVTYLSKPLYTKDTRSGPLLLEALREAFVFEPVQHKGFEGFRLLPR